MNKVPYSPDIECPFIKMQAEHEGITPEEYIENRKIRERISKESKKYKRKDSSKWPKIQFNWDTAPQSQRYSLDGISQEDFHRFYAESFLLGYVFLKDLDKKLCHYSRRDEGELWKVGCTSKLAYLIVYLSENRPISPPLIAPNSALPDQLIFIGGHHRYAIAKETNVEEIPVYVEIKNKRAIEQLINIRWVN